MTSRARFFVAGVAVSAVCFLLASMTWQYVLGLFMLAGVGWGVWLWLAELEREQQRAREARCRRRRLASGKRAPWNRQEEESADNVYQLPLRDWSRSARPGRTGAVE